MAVGCCCVWAKMWGLADCPSAQLPCSAACQLPRVSSHNRPARPSLPAALLAGLSPLPCAHALSLHFASRPTDLCPHSCTHPTPCLQFQGLLRGNSATQQQFAAAQQPQLPYHAAAAALAAAGSPMSPTRGLSGGGSPLAKAVSAPERDLWMAAASLASEAEQKQQEAAAAAAAAAAASANFSFHPQPPSPTFARMGGPLGSAPGSAAGSGLWSTSGGSGAAGGTTSSINRSAGGSAGSGQYRTLSDFSY